MKRGTFKFEIMEEEGLSDSVENVEAIRRLWLDRAMINGEDLGPGDPGDFDQGAWHVSCHAVAAGGVRQAADGRLLWIEISYDPTADQYFSSLTVASQGQVWTHYLNSSEAQALLAGSTLLGFVEGTSTGHVSACGANDSPSRFNGVTRQEYDQPIDSQKEGGKVWEHWCTLRDIRPSVTIADSVLRAYISVVSVLGDLFPATVTRGRCAYGHPKQLCAFVRAGLTSEEAAIWDTTPMAIPYSAEKLLLEARPADALTAVKQLSWVNPPCYHMFQRRISCWSPAGVVKEDLRSSSF